MPAQARFGERVPVPVTTFSPIATGGVSQQPITSFNYENIGVNIDITPRTHHDDEVSLALKIEVSSISGTGFGGLPTFGNRSISTVIRLHDGETNLLAGLIRDDERRVLVGGARAERPAAGRPAVRPHHARDAGNRHRPDADAAHRPRARPERRGPAAVPRRTRRRRHRTGGIIPLPLPVEIDATARTAARNRSRRRRRRRPPATRLPDSAAGPDSPTGETLISAVGGRCDPTYAGRCDRTDAVGARSLLAVGASSNARVGAREAF